MAKIGINIATGSLQKPDMIVGIDLGTTNSLVAIIHPDNKQAIAIKEHDSTALVPSVVHLGEDGTITVGQEALQYVTNDTQNTIFSPKRLMGNFSDIKHNSFFTNKIFEDDSESSVKIQVGNGFYTATQLSSFILKELKIRAEHILKTPVKKAIISVPAYFNDKQRQQTLDAGKLAGLDVLQIINEPAAASLAYGIGLEKDEDKTIAVYDLGGGTFDISILKFSNGIFEVLSESIDSHLGGDDLDNIIVKLWMKEHNIPDEKLSTERELSRQLSLIAERAKRHLSSSDLFKDSALGFDLEITRAEFESAIQPLINKTIRYCDNALRDAGLTKKDVDVILMVGGSTRIPLVKQAVSEFFAKPVKDSLNPEEVVALGAAIQAEMLSHDNKELLTHPLSNVEGDSHVKDLEETRIEAHQAIRTTESFLKKSEPYLSMEEIKNTRQRLEEVVAVFNSGDKDLIREKLDDLQNLSRMYAESIMDSTDRGESIGKKS